MPRAELDPDIYFRLFGEELRKGDRRKISIMEAALELLTTEGIESVNYERIGKKVGMLRAHGTLLMGHFC